MGAAMPFRSSLNATVTTRALSLAGPMARNYSAAAASIATQLS